MATRNRYARFFNKKTNAAVQSQASLPAHSSSTLTKSVSYSSLAANLSQVLMLAVVVVGYVYTVRPVFQKEVISEDLARLQIDQRKLQQQMEKQTDSLLAGEAKNRALADERSSIEGQILALNQKIAASEKSERDAKTRAQKAAAEAMTAESTLARLQSQHYNLKLSSLLGQQELPSSLGLMLQRTWQSLSVDIFDEKAPDAVAQKLKSTQVQPLDLANSTLKQLEASAAKHSRDPGGSSDALLAQNYKKGITEHAAELTCPSPPYEQWQVAFQSALSQTSQPIKRASMRPSNNGQFKKVGIPHKSKAFESRTFGSNRKAVTECPARFHMSTPSRLRLMMLGRPQMNPVSSGVYPSTISSWARLW